MKMAKPIPESVIPSEARNLSSTLDRFNDEILRYAQDDSLGHFCFLACRCKPV